MHNNVERGTVYFLVGILDSHTELESKLSFDPAARRRLRCDFLLCTRWLATSNKISLTSLGLSRIKAQTNEMSTKIVRLC